MKRNLDILKNQLFDVLIIGAGIHGAATARECACHGLKTALIEKSDFGGATSSNSLKIIHGGLRYLQHLNIRRMRESVLSRRIMSEVSPHNIRVIPCLVPNSGFGLQSNPVMWIGLKLNDCIAFDRNRGIAQDCRIPPGGILPISRCRSLFPDIDWSRMSGGSVWYEAMAYNSERLTLAFIKEAARRGACIANYIEVDELLVDEKGYITGCRAADILDNEAFTITAKTVVVSGGAWNADLLKTVRISENTPTLWAKAVNIIVRKSLFHEYAIGLTGEIQFQDHDAVLKKKGRFFFFVPWRGYTMIGTTYKRYDGAPDQLTTDRRDIDELLTEANAIYPAARLTFADVTNAHVGLVPISSHQTDPNSDVQPEKETLVMAYGNGVEAPKGLLSVKSVKFTTAPVVAKKSYAKIARFLRKETESCCGKALSTPAAPPGTPDPTSRFAYFGERYGKECDEVLCYALKNSERVCDSPPFCLGEIDYFLHEEMALTVSDIVFRRSALATAECPSDGVLQKIATHMGRHLGWSDKQREEQIQRVKAHFIWE